jgi:hypothetical protein
MNTRAVFAGSRPHAHGLMLAASVALLVGAAPALAANPLTGAIGETKPIIDLRLRSESVEQTGFAEDASALTLRARLGFETGKAWNTSLLVEGDLVTPLQDDYNSTTNGRTAFPVVADPEVYEINRLQLTNTSLPGTTLTLGRQRIALDDQRFVGPVGWRQNEQTFDAFRVVNRSLKKFVFDFSYMNQVERVFGPDSPQGRFEGDSFLGNVSYATKIGKLTGYGYLLEFDNIVAVPAAVRDSSSTYGLRLAGDKPVGKVKLAYMAAYATQTDYADNPLDFDLDYLNAEVTASFRQFGLGAGVEVLEGNGVKGFTTPLATLHKFQGWADKFLATPPNGLEDRYVNASATLKGVGPLDTLGLTVSFHDFGAERISADYGSEVDLQLAAKWKRVNLLVKYADFNEGALASARDTQKLWAQVEFIW